MLTNPWLDLLPLVGSEVRVNEAVIAKLIEDNDCFLSDLQRGAKHLIQIGLLENPSMKRMRPTNAVHFQGSGELLRRIA
jgi:hypothetical protein